MNRAYKIYELKINSAIPILHQHEQKVFKQPDIVIKIGKVRKPRKGNEDTVYKPCSIYNENFYYHHIPTIATYMVKKNGEVTVQILDKKKMDAIIYFFNDSILPVILIQRGVFLIHGAAVRSPEGKVHVFMSDVSEGKSSLAAGLVLNHKYKLISDDKCLIMWNEKKKCFMIRSYVQHIDLWRNVLPLFKGRERYFQIKRIREGIEKFRINFKNRSYKRAVPVDQINFLHIENVEIETTVEKLDGMKIIDAFKSQIVSQSAISGMGQNRNSFQYTVKLSKEIPCYKVTRSRLVLVVAFAKYINDEVITTTN